jgi:cytochrome b561
MSTTAQRYSAVAIVLHWAIAAAILYMLPLGLWMHEQAEDGVTHEGVFRAFQLHKSIGLAVLALSLIRLGWRLAHRPPPLPQHMPAWERFAAKATHWAFYALMIGLPLSGWLFVSAGWSLHEDRSLAVPTHFFGLLEVPALFGLTQAAPELRAAVADVAFNTHALMAWAAAILFVLHVAAALKHHFFDRDEVLAHMVPGVRAPFETEPRPKDPTRLAILGGGIALVAIALISAVYAATTFGGGATMAAPAASTFDVVQSAPAPNAPSTPVASTAAPTPAVPGAPSAWRVDPSASSIRFDYTYSDESGETPVSGRFSAWSADIRFDPQNLDASSANVTIQLASAATGVPVHDNALRGAGWFNTAAFPQATFRTTEIRSRSNGYEARGDLTLRGETKEVRLPFTLEINGDRAVMRGSVTIDRRDFEIGEDAEGDDMISRDVTINIQVQATRAP